ncbi:MAG: HNH/ENDO VII family nuclease, partial [Lachnospiraceae bacterium]|nr:HNH/ENDO VII family nuclease [Lachnospiraceae bacterium]
KLVKETETTLGATTIESVKAAERAGKEAKAVSGIDRAKDTLERLKKWEEPGVDELKITETGYAKADNNINIDIPDNTQFRDNYDILGKTHTKTDVTGTVYSKGTVNSIDRTVYQMNNIDWDYVSKSPFNRNGLSNRELARKGNTPFGPDDMYIELHHLIQNEPGAMIELMGSKHKKYYKALHGIVENGGSFRNDLQLEAQYNKFRKEYWKERIKQVEKNESKCKKG